MIRTDGWCEGVDRRFSPNYSRRTQEVTCCIQHYTAGTSFEGAIATLSDPKKANPVSAHFVIGQDGKVAQLVSCANKAWHAGPSSYKGQKSVNGFSVGIENVYAPINIKETTNLKWPYDKKYSYPPYPRPQIEANARICAALIRRYGIAQPDIVGHSEVKPTKLDPGPNFPWELLFELITKELENA